MTRDVDAAHIKFSYTEVIGILTLMIALLGSYYSLNVRVTQLEDGAKASTSTQGIYMQQLKTSIDQLSTEFKNDNVKQEERQSELSDKVSSLEQTLNALYITLKSGRR